MAKQLRAIEEERIKVNGEPALPDYRLKNGDRFSHSATRVEPPVYRSDPRPLHEDADFLVVDKPPSLPVHECGAYFHNSLTRMLQRTRGGPALLPPHRLDRLTSGVQVLAKSAAAAMRVGRSIESGAAEKVYLARVEGDMQSAVVEVSMKCLSKLTFTWGVCSPDDPQGKTSRTAFERLSYCERDHSTLLRCRLYTGRTHQIRVHMSATGHPCVGDPMYGSDPNLAKRLGLQRQWLHAVKLGFTHPGTGKWFEIEAPYPADLEHALEVLRG